MKLWLSQVGGALYLLIENPRKEGDFIEANIRVLEKLWHDRRNKRINLRVLFRMTLSWPKDCYNFDYFPRGYCKDWIYEKPSIYFHEIKGVLKGRDE